MKLTRAAKELLVTGAVLCGLAAGIWAIVWGAMANDRGNYAGYHFGEAQSNVTKALVVTYGKDFVSQMRYADPPVLNTHLNNALTGTGQVRVFHLIGPRGVKYCVSIHRGTSGFYGKGGIFIDGAFHIQKGCKF